MSKRTREGVLDLRGARIQGEYVPLAQLEAAERKLEALTAELRRYIISYSAAHGEGALWGIEDILAKYETKEDP